MQGNLEFSFLDLKCKLVVNVTDGKILGNIIDIIFSPVSGKILGFLVPGAKKSFFKPCENIFIPYCSVCKVGIDVILVELFVNPSPPPPCKNKKLGCVNLLEKTDENGETVRDYECNVIDPQVYPS